MRYGLYLSAAGANVQNRRLEVIANNLANTDTTGFKREMAVAQARYSQQVAEGVVPPGMEGINDVGGGVFVRETVTDFSEGPFQKTDISTDLAVAGEGYFTVERDGETMLTRAGNFDIGSGRLTTAEGHPVLSEDGDPIYLLDGGGEIQIAPDGQVLQFEPVTNRFANLGRLDLVRPEDSTGLIHRGENFFQPAGPTVSIPLAKRNIRSGFLEGSTTNPTLEMVDMIATTRAFEANVRMIQNQDESLSQLLSRILRS